MKHSQRLFMLMLLGALAVCLTLPAFALDLESARTSGVVAEKQDGMIAALSAEPGVNALVEEVNGRRQQEYQKISKGNGQPVDVVARLAAKQIIQQLKPGQMYQGDDGAWKKR